jgi:hypothetical protein
MSPTFRSEDAYNEVGQDIRPPSLAEQLWLEDFHPGLVGVGQGGFGHVSCRGISRRDRPAEHHQEKAA